MKNKVIVKISSYDKLNVIRKLVKNNIYYENLRIYEKNIFILVNIKYIKQLKLVFGRKNIKIIKYFGIFKYKLLIKKHYISILSLLFSLLVIFILSNMIFSINIETQNEKLKSKLIVELEEYGIKKYSFKKTYSRLTEIKEKIIKNNKDEIEWIEIEESGTKYNIKLTERKLNKKKESKKARSLVAKKDAVIKKITSTSGVLLKEINDYVKKGETIIDGNIIKGEDELKGTVRAKGKVYGEVWYTVNVTVPYEHVEYEETNNSFNHYYIEFLDKKMTLINYYKLENYRISDKKELKKFYLPFKIVKERVSEYKYTTYHLDKNEALEKAIKKSEDKIKQKLKKDEYIISKKVLKKDYFSSKINIDVFYKVYEDITSYKKTEKIKENIKKGSES